MNWLNTEKLISLVSKYPQLYDGKHSHYADLYRRDLVWQQIGKELGIGAADCKAKWNILRGGYRRALRNKESGCAYTSRKWRFEDNLSFLKDCVRERRRPLVGKNSEVENAENMSDNEELAIKEEPAEVSYEAFSDNVQEDEWASSCGSTPATETEIIKVSNQFQPGKEENGNSAEADGLKQFFLSMVETVRTLPPLVQAQVKAEVFKSVSSAEINYLEGKYNNSIQD